MKSALFWKVTMSILLVAVLASKGFGQSKHPPEMEVGTLSEGSCWYENKDLLKVASFNDKSTYNGSRAQLESELEELISERLGKTEGLKIGEIDLALHCGGYGASLVAKVTTPVGPLCAWLKFEKGGLSFRSLGAVEEKDPTEFCDGYKWGEFIIGANSLEFIAELQSSKWEKMIKEVTLISNKVYKVLLVKEYAFKEQEVIDQLQENFNGKNLIRYIEFNGHRHPVGEFVHLPNN